MIRKFLKFLRMGPRRVEDLVPYPEGKRIYREFHNLRREQMDEDALKVINRLNRHGYRSYLVGGCVRDMIQGKKPKDFDVVTTATPAQIRKIFTNSRPIGRRFKLIHILFRGGKIIEVSTFRSLPDHRLSPGREKDADYMMTRDNEYGTPVEDAARRDFTINALFFDPRNESIIDFVGGYDDIKEGKIRVIGDPDISFREDPVRMLRAAKFAALHGFEMDPACMRAVRKNREELRKASTARMLEEYYKIFRTGRAFEVFSSLAEAGLFRTLFPEASDASDQRGAKVESFAECRIGERLKVADKMLSEREELTSTIFLALIYLDLVADVIHEESGRDLHDMLHENLDDVFRSINLPVRDRERLYQIFENQSKFARVSGDRKARPDQFRKKVFFFETFMVFKINAIVEKNDEMIQQAMFWEIGPRPRPPEPGKIISVFPVRNRAIRDKNGARTPRVRSRKKGHSRSTGEAGENMPVEETREIS